MEVVSKLSATSIEVTKEVVTPTVTQKQVYDRKFIEEQMKCLKPGGIAVHTTEFNLTSNEDTIESPLLSIYRLQDIEKICRLLIQKGYHVEPIDTFTGNHKLDKYVDKPPYAVLDSFDLRLTLGRYVSTSIALIIKK